MYAIVETGGRQYKVQKGDVFDVEKLDAEAGKALKLDKVLLYSKGKSVDIGTPFIKGAHVACEVVANLRGDKLVAFKYRRRKNSKRKIGHRQELTRLRVKEITISE